MPEPTTSVRHSSVGLFEQYIDGLHADRQHLVRSYSFADMARKVVGVGSVGTRAWVSFLSAAMVRTRSCSRPRRPRPRCSSRFSAGASTTTHGERVVRGQRMMQAATDIFLSWQRSVSLDGVERDYYVRQLWDWKASADLSRMTEHGLLTYTRACAWSLARSHARSGDRLAISAYLGKGRVFDRAVTRFASLYADQNELDYRRLQEAAAAGEIDVEEVLTSHSSIHQRDQPLRLLDVLGILVRNIAAMSASSTRMLITKYAPPPITATSQPGPVATPEPMRASSSPL